MANLLLLTLATISVFSRGLSAADLSNYEIMQLCEDKFMRIVAYPGDPTRYIVCLDDKTQTGTCRTETDASNNVIQTCFNEKEQACSAMSCEPARQPTEYDQFVEDYCGKDENTFKLLPADDCEHFYICLGSNADAIRESCPDGFHFSRIHGRCMTPLEASCQTLSSMCDNKERGYRFAGTNCYDYYECRLSTPVAHSCNYGYHFDVVTKKCVPAADSKCVDKTNRLPQCTTKNNGQYFMHPKCDRFYICVNTVALEGQCPQDYYFDAAAAVCKKDAKGVCRG